MAPGIRYSIQELSAKDELKPILDKVIKSWIGIQNLKPYDYNSFFAIGGYHGEPFRGPNSAPGPSASDPEKTPNTEQKLWWGGYCNHGNVLFPTWHRAYLLRLERAMQSIEGCEDVRMPYWDECFDMGNNPNDRTEVPKVIPSILTDQTIEFEGKRIPNPLFSYKLQRSVTYFPNSPKDPHAEEKRNSRYSKPKGYETCRFPKRGIVCNEEEREQTRVWNEKFQIESENVDILNTNVLAWLEGKNNPGVPDTYSVYSKFQDCLSAPNYTVFSNTASQAQWIKEQHEDGRPEERARICSLEAPHNSIHLSIGGFYQKGIGNANPEKYQEANGDMGDNETASFDPIFYFHHCFIDYAFWTWQKKHGKTKRGSLEVIDDYPGTITDDTSPVGLAPGAVLDMETPLYPFRNPATKSWYTSHDMTDLEELDYEYGVGSLDQFLETDLLTRPFTMTEGEYASVNHEIVAMKRSYGINRVEIVGSFVIRTVARNKNDISKRVEVAREAILSRMNVRGCKNCQTHLEAESFFPLYQGILDYLGVSSQDDIEYRLEIDTHDTAYDIGLGEPLSQAHRFYSDIPSDGALDGATSRAYVEDI